MRIPTMVYIETPAKFNLHLDIRDRRTDGYHNLLSIFQSVSLFDTLRVRSLKQKSKCRILGNFDFPACDNIINKAYEAFAAITGISTGIEVAVEKRIPIGAGLGGGSSDAAAVIKCLEMLFEKRLSDDDLYTMASRLGSDVFFFLKTSAAEVTGRGDVITPLHPRSDYELVIIYPGFGISTKTAYSLLDEERVRSKNIQVGIEIKDVVYLYNEKPVSEWKFINTFAGVLLARYPSLGSIIHKLLDSGAAYANITGSGSCIFAVFKENYLSPAIIAKLEKEYHFVFYVKPLDKNPLPVLQ